MEAVRLQATIKKTDVPYIERFLEGIAEEISFDDISISKELEIELQRRYENFKNNPETGIFLEDLKEKTIKKRYGI